MKILSDITPTENTECAFRVKDSYCGVKGYIGYCVPILMHGIESCPYCIGMNDFLHKTAKDLHNEDAD